MAWLARKQTPHFFPFLVVVVNNHTSASVPILDGKIEAPLLL
jgi:hypothetical protein